MTDEDADIEAMTSAAAIATVSAPRVSVVEDAAESAASAATPLASAANAPAQSPTAAAAAAPTEIAATPSTPAKEERKIGKLNMAAFNSPAQPETPSKAVGSEVKVGKLAAFQPTVNGAEEKKDLPPPGRSVGKLTAKMNIPIFAPGQVPPVHERKNSLNLGAGAAIQPSATATGENQTDAPADASAASAAPAASPSGRAPGKLASNALMSNLNAMLAAPGQPRKVDDSAAASASAAAADEAQSAEPAPSITHAKRAKVRRRSKTRPAQLKKAEVTKEFQEVQVAQEKVQKITLVSTAPESSQPQPSPKSSPKAGEKKHAPTGSVDSTASATSSSSTQATPAASPTNATAAAAKEKAQEAQHARDASSAALLAAAAPAPLAAAEPVAPLALDATARAAWSAAALYGEFVEPEFDAAKADEYRMLTAAGATFLKHGASGKPHERVVFVTASLVLYYMEQAKRSKPDAKSSINLSLATMPKITVVKGKTTANFKRAPAAKVDDNLCLSILARERELDLQARTTEERDAWFAAIKYLLHLAQERREAALLESAMGSYK